MPKRCCLVAAFHSFPSHHQSSAHSAHAWSSQSLAPSLVLAHFPTPRMHQYCYRKLPQNSNAIRLLRLLPSRDSPEHIRCELFEYTMQNSATNLYEALSYCWGGEEKPKSVSIISDQDQKSTWELAVTENLYVALSHLRDFILPRVIWVDAVCINQTDGEEKMTQIQLMPAIYAKASRVIVWLGAAQDDSDEAFDLILSAANESLNPPNTQLERARSPRALEQKIQQLLNRPWFSRIWVRKYTNILLASVTKMQV